MSSADPNAVVRAYGGAVSVGHLEIAESVCAAWEGPGDAPARFARQAAAKGLHLDPVAGAWIRDDRAVVPAGVVRAGEANPIDLAWSLLSRGDAAGPWRIEAVTRGASRAGAYLLADLAVPWESFERGPGVPIGETTPLSDEARAELARRVAEVVKPRLEALVTSALAARES